MNVLKVMIKIVDININIKEYAMIIVKKDFLNMKIII